MPLFFVSLLGTILFSWKSNAIETNNPFLIPQTNIGKTVYKGKSGEVKGPNVLKDYKHKEIKQWGMETEVNYNRFTNIGANLAFASTDRKKDNARFSTTIGVFTKFFYQPPFLSSNSFNANIYLKTEVGGGPYLSQVNGLFARGSVEAGPEIYLNKWIGFGVGFGYFYETGKETLITNSKISKEYPEEDFTTYNKAKFHQKGGYLAIYFKTTYF